MQEQTNWADLPEQLLRHTFESQHNALDNCAAACACKSWRAAVNSSHIQSLHLHSDDLSQSWQTSSFFKSRCSLGELKLTAGHCSKDLETFANSSKNTPCVSLLCDSLHVDMSWAHLLHVHTDALAQIKHLVTVPKVHAANGQYAFADLRHLTQLKTLKMLSEDMTTVVQADAIIHSMRQCPATLEQLAIDGQDLGVLTDILYSLEDVLGTTLAQLTCLELTSTEIFLDEGSLACFTHLRSLSFEFSQVHAAVDSAANLTWLSGVTTLDLSGNTWFDLRISATGTVDMALVYSPAFNSFHGWPALEVLKIDGCNLFGPSTALHIPEVQDVQVHHHNHVTDSNRVRVNRHYSDFGEAMSFSYLPHCACFLVELRVFCEPVVRSAAVVQGIQHLLSTCQSLQVLYLENSGDKQPCHTHEQADLVLQDQQAVSLQELQLHYFCFTQIDLRRACSLTSLVLQCADATIVNICYTDCELFLPHSLRFFEFRGRALFAPSSRFKLEDCDSLIKLVITPVVPSSVWSNYAYNIPVLPSSLHHLEFAQRDSDGEEMWVNGHVSGRDWQCLSACTNLEHLTLPSKAYLTPWLRNWIKSARHLHIVEYYADSWLGNLRPPSLYMGADLG